MLRGMPSKRIFISSTESMATPALPNIANHPFMVGIEPRWVGQVECLPINPSVRQQGFSDKKRSTLQLLKIRHTCLMVQGLITYMVLYGLSEMVNTCRIVQMLHTFQSASEKADIPVFFPMLPTPDCSLMGNFGAFTSLILTFLKSGFIPVVNLLFTNFVLKTFQLVIIQPEGSTRNS